MRGDEGGVEDQPELLAAMDDVRATVARLGRLTSQEHAWRSRDADVLLAVAELMRVRAALDAVHLGLVRQVDARGVAEASPVATSVEGFLQTSCLVNRGQAARDVAAARATAPGAVLEGIGDALQDGRCTRAHVDVAVRCVEQLPTGLLRTPAAAEQVSDYLLLAVTEATPREADGAARDLLRALAPDPADRFDPQAHQRRFLDVGVDATGMTVGRFQLDPVAGASFRAALDRWSGPESGADGERDSRQPRQRRADALLTVAETALSVQGPQRGERPRVVVQVTPEQLLHKDPGTRALPGRARVEGGPPLAGWAARRVACDAVLQRLVASPTEGPLELGRTERLASTAQRRALAARDGGCVIPGCGAAPTFCDAHHVVFWADGGLTDLRNLVLLCPGHHTAVHAGTWAVRIDDTGQVWVTPPRWKDSRRTPRPVWRQQAQRAQVEVVAAVAAASVDTVDADDAGGCPDPQRGAAPDSSAPPPGREARLAAFDAALDAELAELAAWRGPPAALAASVDEPDGREPDGGEPDGGEPDGISLRTRLFMDELDRLLADDAAARHGP